MPYKPETKTSGNNIFSSYISHERYLYYFIHYHRYKHLQKTWLSRWVNLLQVSNVFSLLNNSTIAQINLQQKWLLAKWSSNGEQMAPSKQKSFNTLKTCKIWRKYYHLEWNNSRNPISKFKRTGSWSRNQSWVDLQGAF